MRRRSTVLAYHGVGSPPPDEDRFSLFVSADRFNDQMAFLARRRTVVPLDDIVSGVAPAGAVALTFDDGYRHLLTAALPVLERHGFPATMFVPTAHLGGRNTWDPPSRCDLAIMNADELREADRRGLRIESHGHAHLDCTTAPAATVAADLQASVRTLTDVLGRPPRHLAWPYRDGNEQARRLAAEAGFDAAFSIDLPHSGPLSWARVQVAPGDGRLLFAAKTSGHYTRLRYSAAPQRAYRLAKPLLHR